MPELFQMWLADHPHQKYQGALGKMQILGSHLKSRGIPRGRTLELESLTSSSSDSFAK